MSAAAAPQPSSELLMETGSLTQEASAWTHGPRGGGCIFISSSLKKILFSNGSVLRLTGRGGAYGVFFTSQGAKQNLD